MHDGSNVGRFPGSVWFGRKQAGGSVPPYRLPYPLYASPAGIPLLGQPVCISALECKPGGFSGRCECCGSAPNSGPVGFTESQHYLYSRTRPHSGAAWPAFLGFSGCPVILGWMGVAFRLDTRGLRGPSLGTPRTGRLIAPLYSAAIAWLEIGRAHV